MIQRLTLKNFQNHSDTTLDFVPGINVIVGASDSGKTALLRGLEWIRTNRPLGNSFIKHGCTKKDECRVEVHCIPKDGKKPVVVKRVRSVGTTVNEYAVGNSSMKAVGSDVPADVLSTLNLDDLNIQSQLSPHFLILDSPGAVAKAINSAVHLEEMDACVAEANKRVRSLTVSIDQLQKEIESLEKEKAAFPDLTSLEAAVGKAQGKLKRVQEVEACATALAKQVKSLTEAEKELAVFPPSELVSKCIQQIESVVSLHGEANSIRTALERYRAAGIEVKKARQVVDETKATLGKWLEDYVCPTCGRPFDDDACAFVTSN